MDKQFHNPIRGRLPGAVLRIILVKREKNRFFSAASDILRKVDLQQDGESITCTVKRGGG